MRTGHLLVILCDFYMEERRESSADWRTSNERVCARNQSANKITPLELRVHCNGVFVFHFLSATGKCQ